MIIDGGYSKPASKHGVIPGYLLRQVRLGGAVLYFHFERSDNSWKISCRQWAM
ncbi:MAG: hypothetical protein GX425_01880 [Peptococcaceae bacterium]|nr:hypothetical protein [Peptococcaceae bacterium]